MTDHDVLRIREFDFNTMMTDSCTWIVVAPPGSGKCLAPGTPVILYNGTIKKVEDVEVGELLMGDDSTPRTVLSTCSGTDPMYTIYPSVGDPYTVNGPHILCLLKSELNGIEESNILEISVQDYLHTTQNQKHRWRGYRRHIQFQSNVNLSSKIHPCQLVDAIYEAYAIRVVYEGLGPYHGFQLDGNGRFLLGDFTVTHNTTFIENLVYAVKHKYPVARVFCGSQPAYERFSKIFGKLYVTLGYNEAAESMHIRRQKQCAIENGPKHPANYAINILDDVSSDTKVYKTPTFNDIFKNGSQHYHQIFILALQYVVDIPPYVRGTVSYAALFRSRGEDNMKKLYTNFGGAFGNKNKFFSTLEQVTGDYTCMILDMRTQSQKLEDCVFWYRTHPIEKEKPDWKFGCIEYKEWNKARADPDYKDPI